MILKMGIIRNRKNGNSFTFELVKCLFPCKPLLFLLLHTLETPPQPPTPLSYEPLVKDPYSFPGQPIFLPEFLSLARKHDSNFHPVESGIVDLTGAKFAKLKSCGKNEYVIGGCFCTL